MRSACARHNKIVKFRKPQETRNSQATGQLLINGLTFRWGPAVKMHRRGVVCRQTSQVDWQACSVSEKTREEHYSVRKASMGSTRVALRAGR